VDVTQKGGHVLWMLYNRPIGAEENINIDQAKELGKKFLEEHGYKNMVDTYYLKEDNTAIIIMLTNKGMLLYIPTYKSKNRTG